MRTIFKYPVELAHAFQLELPRGAKFINLGQDTRYSEKISLWFEVDTEEQDRTTRTFYIVGTGQPIPAAATQHIGSVIMLPFVWHIYEEMF
jgi:hypothetical protein